MQKHHAGHRMNSIIPVLAATIILVTVCIKPAAAENPFTVFGNQDTDTYIYYQIADADEYSEAMAMYHLEMMVNVFEYRGLIWGFDDLVIRCILFYISHILSYSSREHCISLWNICKKTSRCSCCIETIFKFPITGRYTHLSLTGPYYSKK